MLRFEDHLPPLRAWFQRRVSNPADVDDAVQDVWIRLQKHVAAGAIANMQAYLFQTAQSVLTDRARRAAVRQERAHRGLEEFDHPVEVLTPHRVLEAKQSVAMALAQLETLPERTRTVFVLHRFEGMSYGEIARQMGISVSAVEKHIMKALRSLTETLG